MENNFLSLIKTRRSVRAYKPQPVPSEALDAVLEAGTYVKTSHPKSDYRPLSEVIP